MKKRGSSTIDVSFAVASFNSGHFLEPCVNSALSQEDITCEVLIVDDGSSDGSDTLAMKMAERDPRVRFFRTPANLGPGGARNIAIENMRGNWYAVLDSDDLLDRGRSRHLIDTALARNADLISDDLIMFGDGLEETRFLTGSPLPGSIVSLDDYFANSVMYGKYPNPGFLKPLIAHDLLEAHAIRYDERLRVSEDDDLIIRLLMQGARYYVDPSAGYRYRKHGESISHRLAPDHARAMGERSDRLARELSEAGQHTANFRARHKGIKRGIAFTHAIEAIKRRDWFRLIAIMARNPGSITLFSMPIKSRLARIFSG